MDLIRLIGQNHSIGLSAVLFSLLSLLSACGNNVLAFTQSAPAITPTTLHIQIETTPFVTNTPRPTQIPSPSASPTTLPSIVPVVTLTHTPTPASTSTPTPLPVLPTITPISLATGEISSTGSISATIPAIPFTDRIQLVDPIQDHTLPLDAEAVEFKWLWLGGPEFTPCQVPDNYGFEIRIWPHNIPNSPVPTSPEGVVDAVKEQKDLLASCFQADSLTCICGYTVQNIKSRTPSAIRVKGEGPFFWDIAYIQLDPYTVIAHSDIRTFNIPPKPEEK